MSRVPGSALKIPLHAEGTVTRGDRLARSTFRVVLEGESRGVLDLRCATGERLPSDLHIGEELRLALELDRSVIAVEGRVSARTGSSVRMSISGSLAEQPRRRRHTRVRINQPTTVRVERGDGREVTVPARLLDLSAGGCSLQLDVLVAFDATITVEVDLPQHFTLTGTVIRAGGGDLATGTIGVRFRELSTDAQLALQQFLHDRARYRL